MVWVLIFSLGWSFGRGDLVALKARTLDIWPCAVKIDDVAPVERLAEESRVKEAVYEIISVNIKTPSNQYLHGIT